MLAGLACACALPLHAAGTPAGTLINNTANVTYDTSGSPATSTSNTTTLKVAERLDVTVVSNGNVAVTTPQTGAVLSFTVTNTGNGSDTYALAATSTLSGDNFDPTLVKIVIDNGNGVYEPGVDADYVAGTNDPVLAADAGRVVFLVNNIPAGRANGDTGFSRLQATSRTGSGAPGTTFAGQGDSGSDAVVGSTTADARTSGTYTVAQAFATLTKAQTVTDPQGGSNAVQGSTIAYTLTFTATGSGTLNSAQVTDAIPAGSHYVAGSLLLDGSPISDAADADAGRFTGSGIEVNLGNVPAPASHTVQFRVLID